MLDRFPSREEAYEARRTRQALTTGMTPLELPTPKPTRERSCVECERNPVPIMLAGYDRARISVSYDWAERK